MKIFFFVFFGILFLFFCYSIVFRTLLFNIHLVGYYSIMDIFKYIIEKKWKLWNGFGIRMYCGYFGTGKSMLASKYICDQFRKYEKTDTPITVLSNIPLSIDYIPLKNIQQILDIPENSIIFIDECNTLFNARAWKDFPTELVYQLCQNRKKHIMLIMTAPRFHLVDKSIRDVTEFVYQCKRPFWRIHVVSVFDGWEWENCPNINMLRPLNRYGIFAKNEYYDNYDSFAVIDNVKKVEFLSKEEILNNRRGDFIDSSTIEKSKKYNKSVNKNSKIVKVKK